jgi:hypothetical protein
MSDCLGVQPRARRRSSRRDGTPEAIQEWALELQRRFPTGRLAVALAGQASGPTSAHPSRDRGDSHAVISGGRSPAVGEQTDPHFQPSDRRSEDKKKSHLPYGHWLTNGFALSSAAGRTAGRTTSRGTRMLSNANTSLGCRSSGFPVQASKKSVQKMYETLDSAPQMSARLLHPGGKCIRLKPSALLAPTMRRSSGERAAKRAQGNGRWRKKPV